MALEQCVAAVVQVTDTGKVELKNTNPLYPLVITFLKDNLLIFTFCFTLFLKYKLSSSIFTVILNPFQFLFFQY